VSSKVIAGGGAAAGAREGSGSLGGRTRKTASQRAQRSLAPSGRSFETSMR
jgi:hypothetical protein